jgi:hypothetical protein
MPGKLRPAMGSIRFVGEEFRGRERKKEERMEEG